MGRLDDIIHFLKAQFLQPRIEIPDYILIERVKNRLGIEISLEELETHISELEKTYKYDIVRTQKGTGGGYKRLSKRGKPSRKV